MPGIENWINCPLGVIQRLFDEDQKNHEAKVKDYFAKRIEEADSGGQLPCLNTNPSHLLVTNSLVKFRGMVQDMFDPEYYLGVYEVENLKSGQKHLKSGKYRDLAECAPNEEIKLDSGQNKTLDRQCYYCIPIPAETDWVKLAYARQQGADGVSIPSTSVCDRQKRALEEDSEESVTGQSMETDITTEKKKSKSGVSSGAECVDDLDLNFPLPGESGTSCFLKMYDTTENIKLNDVVEVVGILSNDPAMASFPEDNKLKEQKSSFVDPSTGSMDGVEEEQTSQHPPSLVPHLHVLSLKKLSHNNPLLRDTPPDLAVREKIVEEAERLRAVLLSVIEKLLFGDKLAAEYLMCHLISSVYLRRDVVALGKFALNLSGCPQSGSFPQLIFGFLRELVTKCHLLPMTLDNMNTISFIPKKDYKKNRLKSGLLQLSEDTQLVLDETALQAGQLDTNGVGNITALGNVITWQKVDYDFNYHKQEFSTNITVLVLSEGRSILKCDCQVPLVAGQGGFPRDLEAHFTAVVRESLGSLDLMTELRRYLTVVRQLSYTLTDDMQKAVGQDFVDTRKMASSNMSVEDFHALLVLTRLLSLSHGHTTLSQEMWERAKILEVERKTRLVLTSADSASN